MRLLLFAAALVASGCLYATPMMTPETLAPGRTRVEAGLSGLQPSVRVRHGLTPRVEAGARAEVYVDGDFAVAVVGADASVQVLRPRVPGAFGVVANLGASASLAGAGALGDGTLAAYPTVILGTETAYGGVRGLVALDRSWLGAAPFVGVRVPASGGASRYYLGLEVAALSFFDGDGVGLYPALTFGRRQNR